MSLASRRPGRRRAWRLALPFVLVLSTTRPLSLRAQSSVINVTAGGGSASEGGGIRAGIWSGLWDGYLGFGVRQGTVRGGVFARRAGPLDTLRFGDDVIQPILPTDVFGVPRATPFQGVSATHAFSWGTSTLGLGGVAHESSTPYVPSLRVTTPVVYGDEHVHVAPDVTASLFGATGPKPTTLAGVEWTGPRGWMAGASGGFAGGTSYGALAGTLALPRLEAKVLLATDHPGARRVAAGPGGTSFAGPNVQILVEPWQGLTLSASRQRFEMDSVPAAGVQGVTATSLLAGARALGFRVAGGINLTEGLDTTSFGSGTSSYVSISRQFGRRFGTDLYLLHAAPKGQDANSSAILHLTTAITKALTLTQQISYNGTQSHVLFGGAIRTDAIELGADYQVYYTPLTPARPFQSALALTAKFRSGVTTSRVQTLLTSAGGLQYGGEAGTYVYLGEGPARVGRSISTHPDRLLVQGRVDDELGHPVADAAIALGGTMVYTNRQGRFTSRTRSSAPQTVAVRLDEFLGAESWEVVSAPTEVTPEPDDQATPLVIRLRHVRATLAVAPTPSAVQPPPISAAEHLPATTRPGGTVPGSASIPSSPATSGPPSGTALGTVTMASAADVVRLDAVYVALRARDTTAAMIGLHAMDSAAVTDGRIYLVEAAIQRARGQLPLAMRTLERGLTRTTDRTELQIDMALTQAFQGQLTPALRTYDAILGDHPELVSALTGRAWIYAWSGRTDDATREFSGILAVHPADRGALAGFAYLAKLAGRVDDARARFTAILAMDSTDTDARAYLTQHPAAPLGTPASTPRSAVSPAAPTRVSASISPPAPAPARVRPTSTPGMPASPSPRMRADPTPGAPRSATVPPPEWPVAATGARPTMSSVYAALRGRDTTSALALLACLDAARSTDPHVYLVAAAIERAHHQIDAATSTLTRGLARTGRTSDRTALDLDLAVTYGFAGQFALALATYDTLLHHAPALVPARTGRAWVLAWSGESVESQQIFDAVHAAYPADRSALSGLAFLAKRAGHYDALRAYATALLALDPTDADARAYLAAATRK